MDYLLLEGIVGLNESILQKVKCMSVSQSVTHWSYSLSNKLFWKLKLFKIILQKLLIGFSAQDFFQMIIPCYLKCHITQSAQLNKG